MSCRVTICLVALFVALPSISGATERRARFDVEHEEQLLGLDDFEYDSDWIPAGSAIQVRLFAHAGNTMYLSMDGEAVYEWDTEAIHLEGDPDGGWYDMDIGAEFLAQVRFEILGYTWEGDLIDPFLYGVFESITFDPYLLQGHPDRPATLDAVLPRETLADVPLGIDLLIASGTLHIEIGGTVHSEIESIRAQAWPQSDPLDIAELTQFQTPVPLPADSRDADLLCAADLLTRIRVDMTFLLYPSVVITLLGTDYTLAEIEVPIDVPTQEVEWLMGPEELVFEAPPPDAGDDDDSAPGTHGSEGGDDDLGHSPVSTCDCSVAPAGAASWMTLGLLPALLLRRRRTDAERNRP